MAHRELGRKQLDFVANRLDGLATVENPPRMEGRFLSMILVPNRDAVADILRKEAAAEKAETEAEKGAETASPKVAKAAAASAATETETEGQEVSPPSEGE